MKIKAKQFFEMGIAYEIVMAMPGIGSGILGTTLSKYDAHPLDVCINYPKDVRK